MELFYREYGQGQPFIILHGLYGISDNWVTIARRISEKFRVFIPDLRNHGQSPHHPVHTYPALANDIEQFILGHDIENPVVMGHSMGGKTAMLLALNRPGLLERLIVVDISFRAYPLKYQHLDILDIMKSVDFSRLSTRQEVEEVIAGRIPERHTRLFIMKNLFRGSKDQFSWRLNLEALDHNLDHITGEIDLQGIYPGPVLFIRGGRSDYLPDEDIPKIRQHFPAAVVETIPRATHWVHADAPVSMCHLIRKFTGQACDYPEA